MSVVASQTSKSVTAADKSQIPIKTCDLLMHTSSGMTDHITSIVNILIEDMQTAAFYIKFILSLKTFLCSSEYEQQHNQQIDVVEIIDFIKAKKIFNNTCCSREKHLRARREFLQRSESTIHEFSSCGEAHTEFHSKKTCSDILMFTYFMAVISGFNSRLEHNLGCDSECDFDSERDPEHRDFEHSVSCILYRLCGLETESIFSTFKCECEMIKKQIHKINKLLN